MRTNRIRLLPDGNAGRTLALLGDRVSALWNAANYVCRQAFLAGGRVPGYKALCAGLKAHETYRALPSDERVLERGTSETCPSCGSTDVVRRPWSVLRCRTCGLVMEANQAASRNIAKKSKPSLWDGAEAAPRPEALRWTKHRWADASNPLHPERLAA